MFSLTILISCSNKNNKQIDGKFAEKIIKNKSKTEDFKYKTQLDITHKIDINCEGDYIPIRKKEISKSELSLSNSGTIPGNNLNDKLIIAYAYDGLPIELVAETKNFFKIKFNFKNRVLEGYIIKSFCNKPTITTLNILESKLSNSNIIQNPELLPYCRVFISEKIQKLLIQGKDSKEPFTFLRQILNETQTELILFSVFVGSSQRNIYANPHYISSDVSKSFNCIRNNYYYYEFGNYSNMFHCTVPKIPTLISSYSLNKNNLKISISKSDDNSNSRYFKLKPVDEKRAFTSRKGSEWVLNDSIKLIDISYISDKLVIPESQKGHSYFFQILELYIQEILPKTNESYLGNYIE